MTDLIIQSAGGIVYYIDQQFQPRYLLIKRQAKSKKIERVAPKGKVQTGESPQVTAIREIVEETGLSSPYLHVEGEVGVVHLRNDAHIDGYMDKDTTYFLVKFTGNPSMVRVIDAEGYLGMYKRATIEDVLQLIYYVGMRELIRKAHAILQKNMAKHGIREHFLQLLTKN